MKKLKGLISQLIIVLMVFAIFPFIGYSNATSKVPERIKIGIRYGESATPIVSMQSISGLELGYMVGDQFEGITSFIEDNGITIRKDGFFINANGLFIERNSNNPIDLNEDGLIGPIHIQMGDGFSSEEEARVFIESLPQPIEMPYVVYEDGWKVWIGLYATFQDAERALDLLEESMAELNFTIISEQDQRIQVADKFGKVLFMYNMGEENYQFRPIPQKEGDEYITLDGKKFRGNMMIKRYSSSDLTIINDISLEEYLYGVVPREMSGEWPIEAQKAQAVAARNYAIVNLDKHAEYGFDLCATTHCQVYGGYSSEHPQSRRAVDETYGRLLTYEGKVVTAFYHSNSGGHTEDSENIWSFPLGYIRGVDDPYSIGYPNDQWTKSYTKQEIEDILLSKDMYVGSLLSITATEYSKNGRVLKLEAEGSEGKKILEKEKVRSIFGYNNIKSTYFNIMTDGSVNVLFSLDMPPKTINTENKSVITADGVKTLSSDQGQYIYNGVEYKSLSTNSSQFTFSGKGWGHGLGMSQWGAKKMAEEGFTYDEILTYYYTGTKIE